MVEQNDGLPRHTEIPEVGRLLEKRWMLGICWYVDEENCGGVRGGGGKRGFGKRKILVKI